MDSVDVQHGGTIGGPKPNLGLPEHQLERVVALTGRAERESAAAAKDIAALTEEVRRLRDELGQLRRSVAEHAEAEAARHERFMRAIDASAVKVGGFVAGFNEAAENMGKQLRPFQACGSIAAEVTQRLQVARKELPDLIGRISTVDGWTVRLAQTLGLITTRAEAKAAPAREAAAADAFLATGDGA